MQHHVKCFTKVHVNESYWILKIYLLTILKVTYQINSSVTKGIWTFSFSSVSLNSVIQNLKHMALEKFFDHALVGWSLLISEPLGRSCHSLHSLLQHFAGVSVLSMETHGAAQGSVWQGCTSPCHSLLIHICLWWEIFHTGDTARRDKLMYFLPELFCSRSHLSWF